MKRCPECRRDYFDDSLIYCLDDGNTLLEGPGTMSEPATAILSVLPAVEGGSMRDTDESEMKTAILQPPATAGGTDPADKQSFSVNRAAKPLAAVILTVSVLAGGFFGYRYFSSANSKQIESIAVMPFVNDSGNADIEYLTDGMTETIIGNLSQLPKLSVKARSSVFRYKGKDTDPKTIGKELNVQAILTGRVVERGDLFTVSLSLIEAATENVIWSQQYTRKQTELVSLPGEVAREVSSKLRPKLSDADEQRLGKNNTTNAEAYHLYLKGRFYWDKHTPGAYKEAIDYYNKAIDKDPKYALAYSGLANTYVALGIDYSKPKEAFPLAKLYAQKALDLAPDLAEAHAALGSINFFYDWDWTAADKELKHVFEIDPESSEPYACTLHYLDSAGNADAAVAEVKRVAEQHPTSIVINAEIGCSSYYAHRYDDAITDLKATLEMDPGFATAYYNLGRAYGQKKMYKEAIAALTKANELSADTPFMISELGYAQGMSGNKTAAQATLLRLEKESSSKYVDAYIMAIVYMGLGDKEKALAELDKALQERSTWLIWVKVEPKFESLHAEPRFAELLKQLKL